MPTRDALRRAGVYFGLSSARDEESASPWRTVTEVVAVALLLVLAWRLSVSLGLHDTVGVVAGFLAVGVPLAVAWGLTLRYVRRACSRRDDRRWSDGPHGSS